MISCKETYARWFDSGWLQSCCTPQELIGALENDRDTDSLERLFMAVLAAAKQPKIFGAWVYRFAVELEPSKRFPEVSLPAQCKKWLSSLGERHKELKKKGAIFT